MQDRNWGMLAVFSVIMGMAMSLPIYGGSVINTAMARGLGWDATALGLLVAGNMVATALLLPLGAKATQRIGVANSLVIGFAAMILGALGLIFLVRETWHAVIAYSLMMGATSAFSGVVPCQTGVAAWFPRRRTLALSILYAAVGTLTFGFISLITRIVALTGDWRGGWYVFVGAGAVGILLSVTMVREPPRAAGAQGPLSPGEIGPPPGAVAVYPDQSYGQAVRTPLLWVIALAMIITTAGSIFLTAHAQVYLLALQFSASQAASSLAVMQVGMVFGNLTFGFFAARLQLRRTMALALIAFALSFVLLAGVTSIATLYLFAIAAGIGFGAGQVGCMALLSHYWSPKVFPALTATGLITQTVGSAVVPIMAGRYYDLHGSYLPPIYAMAIANVLVAALIYFAGREPKRQPEASVA